MTSESGSTALRAYRTRPNDHKSQMVLQALLIAAAWNFVLALAVTIYIRSWSGLLALPAEEGVPVLFFFSFFLFFSDATSTACGGLLVDRNPCFRDITKLLLTERGTERYYIREILPITVLCGRRMVFSLWVQTSARASFTRV